MEAHPLFPGLSISNELCIWPYSTTMALRQCLIWSSWLEGTELTLNNEQMFPSSQIEAPSSCKHIFLLSASVPSYSAFPLDAVGKRSMILDKTHSSYLHQPFPFQHSRQSIHQCFPLFCIVIFPCSYKSHDCIFPIYKENDFHLIISVFQQTNKTFYFLFSQNSLKEKSILTHHQFLLSHSLLKPCRPRFAPSFQLISSYKIISGLHASQANSYLSLS